MRRFNSKNATGLLLLVALVVMIVIPACHENREPLDRNRAPETYLTIAPPETTETEYRVHMYWHGEDRDGIVTRFLWYRSDTLRTLRPDLEPEIDQLDWNPEARREDLLRAHTTTATDTTFIFTGFDSQTGAMLNRQAFHIAAVDDGGLIDRTPARLQFFAQVNGIPEVDFWVNIDDVWTPFDINHLDTISMFVDLPIRFKGSTINGDITGYKWVYEGKTYPDVNNDGVAEWYRPADGEVVQVDIDNEMGGHKIASGDFYFKVIAQDEAGALSKTDLETGEGVCHVVVNYDPDVEILHANSYYTAQDGDTAIRTVNFHDGVNDTVPYNSRLNIHYKGWDDKRDILEYSPPVPIRFRYKYYWKAYGFDGALATYDRSWLPQAAEDTNCDSDEDSVTMRVGTYEYLFIVRSYDEQYRYDHTPDSVRFFGNFPPTIDRVQIGIDSIPYNTEIQFHEIDTDTLFIGLDKAYSPRGDTCTAYSAAYNPTTEIFTYFFRFFIKGTGHDDPRDPPGSGIKGWNYNLEAAEDYYFRKEGEWNFEFPTNQMMQELIFRLDVPKDPNYPGPGVRPDPAFADSPPGFMGQQQLFIKASDISDSKTFKDEIRGSSPVFSPAGDPCGTVVSLGSWATIPRTPANYARTDTYSTSFYIKLVY